MGSVLQSRCLIHHMHVVSMSVARRIDAFLHRPRPVHTSHPLSICIMPLSPAQHADEAEEGVIEHFLMSEIGSAPAISLELMQQLASLTGAAAGAADTALHAFVPAFKKDMSTSILSGNLWIHEALTHANPRYMPELFGIDAACFKRLVNDLGWRMRGPSRNTSSWQCSFKWSGGSIICVRSGIAINGRRTPSPTTSRQFSQSSAIAMGSIRIRSTCHLSEALPLRSWRTIAGLRRTSTIASGL
jgi:hypothetical protein